MIILIIQKYRQETIYLGIVWIGLSFAGFGIQTSVPNQIRNLRYQEYNNKTVKHPIQGESQNVEKKIFNYTIDNMVRAIMSYASKNGHNFEINFDLIHYFRNLQIISLLM